jgi:hypothetical protein
MAGNGESGSIGGCAETRSRPRQTHRAWWVLFWRQIVDATVVNPDNYAQVTRGLDAQIVCCKQVDSNLELRPPTSPWTPSALSMLHPARQIFP